MEKLNSKPSNLNGMHQKLADNIIADHNIESPYPKLPPYEYHSLRKGMKWLPVAPFLLLVTKGNLHVIIAGLRRRLNQLLYEVLKSLSCFFQTKNHH